MNYYYTPYVLPLALTTLLTLGLSAYLWQNRKSPGAPQLMLILLAVSAWTAAYTLELLGQDLLTKRFWAQVQYFGIVTLPMAWLHFSLVFPKPIKWGKHPRWWWVGSLLVVPALILVMVWTPGLNDWIWVTSHLDRNQFFLVVHSIYGPGFWIFTCYAYILFLLGSIRLVKVGLAANDQVRNQMVMILVAVLAPLIGNVIYLLDISPIEGLDLSPFGFAVSGLALFWAILGQRMMELVPIARNTVLENMQSAVIVVDDARRIMDLNPAAARLLGVTGKALFMQPIEQALRDWPDLLEILEDESGNPIQQVLRWPQAAEKRWFDLRVSPIRDKKSRQLGHVVLLLDTSAHHQAREELLVLRQAVETSGEVIFMTDIDGLITYINPEFTRLYGYSQAEVLGVTTPRILKGGEMSAKDYERFWHALLLRQTVKQHFINQTRDGRLLTIESSASPILNESGEIVGFMAIQYDSTEESRRKQIIQRHLIELKILHAVSQAGVEYDDEDDLLEYATGIIGEAFFPDNFGVLLVDPAMNLLRFHPAYQGVGDEVRKIEIPLGEGVTGRVAANQQSRCIQDVSLEADYILSGDGMRSELCVPLVISNQTIGVLNAECRQVGAFSQEDERLLGTFAGQLATALARVRLLKAERKQSDRQAALFDLSASLANAMEEDQIAHSLVHSLKTSLGYNHVGLFLLDEVDGDRVLVASEGWPEASKGWRLPPGKGLSAGAIESGRLQYTPDVRTTANHLQGIRGGLSEVDVPLQAGGDILGVLIVERVEVGAFDQGDLIVLTAAANQAATAIERARLFGQVQRLAITDELTGLHNRRHFFNLAEAEFARAQRFERSIAVIMMDLDHFKQVNDTYGHVVGDEILSSLARRCRGHIRQIDILGRYGGEEFVLLLPETDLQAACQTAERLRLLVVEEPVSTGVGAFPITVSMGVTASSTSTVSLVELIDQADHALLQSKQYGRNRVMCYSQEGQILPCTIETPS